MASYQKTIVVKTTENETNEIFTESPKGSFFPKKYEEILYVSKQRLDSYTTITNIPTLTFDLSEIPEHKKITKTILHIYGRYSHNPALEVYGMYNVGKEQFNLKSGWNSIETSAFNGIAEDARPWLFIEQVDSVHKPFSHAEIYSHLSDYKPYIVVTYEDVPPGPPSSLYPNNTTVNARNVIRFSWKHNSEEGTQQKGFTLQYSIDGGSTWVTVSQTTSNQYYDLPKETLPLTGEILWRVKTKDQNDLESPYTNAKFNTAVVPQKPPTLVSPLSGYLDGSKPITFKWNFIGGTAEDKQGKYDLQYSINQGASWTTITVESEESEHIVPENTFQSGNIYWRVRTYNTYGDVSPYSQIGSFYVINSPPIPQITEVTNSAKPTVTWISTEQYLYELQILRDEEVVFNSGAIPNTSDRSYKIDDFLDDGNYKARFRVMNQYNLYSDWAEYNFTIATVKPDKPNLIVYNGEYSVTLETNDTSLKTLVYRDNKLIGEAIDNRFIDYTGENKKEYAYFIRVVDEEDNFNDSNIELGKCSFKGNTIALASKPEDYVVLKYGVGDIPGKSSRITNNGTLTYFDGRKYPATEFSEHKGKEKSLSFFIKDLDKLNKLIDLIDKKETLLYRDINGEIIYGTVLNIDYRKSLLGYEVSFTINKVDYEGVSYD